MLRDQLERDARERGLEDHVRFASAELLPGTLLAAADLVVFPGPRQDDPLPLLEAMVRGRTVVAGAAGVAHELIESLCNGRLVRPGDVDDLAETLATLARHQDASRRLGAVAAARAREEHAWPRIIETLEAIYDEVLGLTSFAPDSLQALPAKP
jgi:glycosyltransferase involved in cell wall biosynthesis